MLAEAEAEAMAALGLEEKGAVVVTAAAELASRRRRAVAARLKERFDRPAFAIALEPGGIGTGSGRSIAGVDLGRAVRQRGRRRPAAQGRRPRHGGGRHAAARARSREFRAYLEERAGRRRRGGAARRCAADRRRGQRRRRQRSTLIATIARAGPFGAGNPEPVFALPAHTVAYAEEVGQAHVRARLRSGDGAMLNAIAFRAADQPLGQALLAEPRPAGARRRHARRSTAGTATSACSSG